MWIRSLLVNQKNMKSQQTNKTLRQEGGIGRERGRGREGGRSKSCTNCVTLAFERAVSQIVKPHVQQRVTQIVRPRVQSTLWNHSFDRQPNTLRNHTLKSEGYTNCETTFSKTRVAQIVKPHVWTRGLHKLYSCFQSSVISFPGYWFIAPLYHCCLMVAA